MRATHLCRFFSIVLLAALLPSTAASARQFVVAQKDPGASDYGPGSEQHPFKTISAAAGAVLTGDTVIIDSRVSPEQIRPERNVIKGAPIIFAAAPGETVIITGADVISDWQRVAGDAPIFSIPWLHRFTFHHYADGEPIEFNPHSAPLWGRAEQVMVDGTQLRPESSLEDLRRAWQQHQQSRQGGAAVSPIEQSPLPNLGPTFAGAFAVNSK